MPSDADLVHRARGGDRDAFAALVERHHATLLRCCRRMVGDSAHDAAQDAVVTAMLSLDRLRDDERFGAWLVGIGLNACRALLRGVRPHESRRLKGTDPLEFGATPSIREGSDPLSGGDSRGLTPHEVACAREVAGLVRAAIAELPRGQREAVTLYYLAGLTQAEAAEYLGIPPGAVKTRLHKARVALRTRLEPLRRERAMQLQMQVTDVRRAGDHHIVVLTGEGRDLMIWVGPAEATALVVALEGVELPRPTPYALTVSLLEASGNAVREIRISRLVEHTFYAEVVLADGGEVDARPSDALNLALATGAPILVDEQVLAESERTRSDWVEEVAAAEAATDDRHVLADEARQRLARTQEEIRRRL
jgi:RNA polymerase sigma-70 factor, ECF subfamily